jgi:hypothetical protein
VFLAGDTEYPLVLLDTLAVSELVKSDRFFRSFYEWSLATDPVFVPSFSGYKVLELRQAPEVFRGFVERFRNLPCVLLKGHHLFLQEEVAAYPDPSRIDPVLLRFTPFGWRGNKMETLPALMEHPDVRSLETKWHAEKRPILDGMTSLVANYRPAGQKYTADEIQQFVFMAGVSQLTLREAAFMEAQVKGLGQAVDLEAFPSLKASLYTTFYKFYADRDRKPNESDAFDVLISAEVPYVEAFITERHQAEVLRKTKQRDPFLDHVRVFTLSDFRDGPPG